MPSTWLITGVSSGLGKSIAAAALKAGHKVIGTTRDVSKASSSNPEFASQGGKWLALDPAHKDAYEAFKKCAVEEDVDVLVNSAGYAFIGAVEDTSEDEVRDQMEINFYGPLRAVRACLPVMRAKKSGHIVLISSGAGFRARPARGTYSASKFAIEAIHESLSYEVPTFNIKLLIVEPGAFRTAFSSTIRTPAQYESSAGLSEAYKGTAVEGMVAATKGIMGIPDFVRGDPDKAASAVVTAVDEGHEYLRMPLGRDCTEALEDKIGQLQRDLEATREIAAAAEID